MDGKTAAAGSATGSAPEPESRPSDEETLDEALDALESLKAELAESAELRDETKEKLRKAREGLEEMGLT